jgi:signal transduction histidine kinase
MLQEVVDLLVSGGGLLLCPPPGAPLAAVWFGAGLALAAAGAALALRRWPGGPGYALAAAGPGLTVAALPWLGPAALLPAALCGLAVALNPPPPDPLAPRLVAERRLRRQAEEALGEARQALAAAARDLDSRVAERTSELAAANEELERFAYIASHDLRAPLRALMTIPEWLAESLEASYGSVDPAVARDLHEMTVQSARLDRLLTDLLAYARIGRSGVAWQAIDTEAAVREAALLAGLPPGFSVEVEGRLPRIGCIPPEFALIMRNLIANAVKHHDRSEGRIVVSARQQPGATVLVVRDDGPGIPHRYADRIFEMFSTLRPRDEVEGSGMGLAMVKKIVEAAGGRVRLGGTDGERGAVFELTFPALAPGGVDPVTATGNNSRSLTPRPRLDTLEEVANVQDPARGGQPFLGPRPQPQARPLG